MPMHYDDESPEPLLLNSPPLPDELAVRMYELLQLFLEQYEERYLDQIQRFYYERDREQQKLRAQMLFDQAQHPLPAGGRQTLLAHRHSRAPVSSGAFLTPLSPTICKERIPPTQPRFPQLVRQK